MTPAGFEDTRSSPHDLHLHPETPFQMLLLMWLWDPTGLGSHCGRARVDCRENGAVGGTTGLCSPQPIPPHSAAVSVCTLLDLTRSTPPDPQVRIHPVLELKSSQQDRVQSERFLSRGHSPLRMDPSIGQATMLKKWRRVELPCRPTALGPAVLPPCYSRRPAALLPCCPAALLPCRHASLLLCRPAPSCSAAPLHLLPCRPAALLL